MKKILSLLFLSSSIFSMELALVHNKQAFDTLKSQYNPSIAKDCSYNRSQKRDELAKLYIAKESLFVPNKLGSLNLAHDKKGFCVYKDGEKHRVKPYNVDKFVRHMTKEELQSFLAHGYVCVNKLSNEEYALKASGRINGGGPMLGAAMYWITKSLCYGVAGAGIITATVATGGAVGTAVAGAVGTTAAAGTVVAGTVTAVNVAGVVTGTVVAGAIAAPAAIATTAGVITASAATAGTVAGIGAAATTAVILSPIAGTAVGSAAVLTTAAGVTVAASSGAAASIGTGAACVLGIETLSTAVGTFFGMLPTP